MLEIKNLCKTYKAKGGVITKALDNVSVVFPEKGMVFLLGKSGSGKSTLLNVTGGLDKPDSGEIIIKGRNSKTFSGSDFDSYRNTFIGFIFQDYNILNEFNVEQNIGLALQLQGKPNDKRAVDAILKQVDLNGFGKRKPNTLSGGQKQRIAIARALIKNPEIIMADEPTGALDSKTGQQVFDTLKKLSREKLVIVVSHDRDFAEIYGDRIIELSDGKILSDVTKFVVDSRKISDNVQIVNPNTVTIKNSAALSPQDINQIYALLRSKSGEVVISSGEHNVKAVKQATHIRADNKSEIFYVTKKQEAPNYNGKKTKFIRSRLPFSRAFKMGSSTLKLKPGRMILTILLTTVALTMFGVTSTLMLYDQSYALNSALKSLPNDSEVIQKKYNVTRHYVTYNQDFTVDKDTKNEDKNAAIIGKADIVDLNNNNVGHKYAGVVTSGSWGDGSPLGLSNFTSNSYYYAYFDFGGLIDAGEEYINNAGFSLLSGAYPTAKNELAISKFMYESMKADTTKGINSYSDVVGHSFQFSLRNYMTSVTKDLTITGIYDVGEVPAAFNDIKDGNPTELLKTQYDEYIKSSFHTVAFVAPSFIDENDYKPVARNNGGTNYNFSLKSSSFESYIENIEDEYRQASFYPASVVSKGLASMTFYNTNGEKTTYSNPESNQVWISYSYFQENVYTSNSKLGSKVLQIVDYNHLDSAARSAFADETYKTSVRQAAERVSNKRTIWDNYPTGHDYEEDLELIKPIFNTHFNNVGGKVFDIYKARFALQQYNNINGWGDNEYTQNHNLTDELLNNSVEASLIDSKINQINSFYETHNLASWLYEYEASRISEQLVWSLDQYRKIATSQEIAEIESYVTGDVMVFHSYGDSLKQAFHEFGEKYIEPDILDTYFFGVYGKDKSHIGDYVSTLHYYFNKRNVASRELTIKGFYDDGNGGSKTGPIIDTEFAKSLGNLNEWLSASFEESNYVRPTDERYTYAITKTQYSEAQIKNLLSQKDTFFYEMTNSSYAKLSMVLDMINNLKQIFLIIGIVFAGFAALMLLNFIASSISSQTKEIGILRAVGARGSDLFKIYFSASGILAAICLVIAIVGSAITCWRLNVSLGEALGISLLKFGILNVGIVFGGSILIALIGTFIPVLIASKKPPIDSIRTL